MPNRHSSDEAQSMPNRHSSDEAQSMPNRHYSLDTRFRFLTGMLAALYELRSEANVLIDRQFKRLDGANQPLNEIPIDLMIRPSVLAKIKKRVISFLNFLTAFPNAIRVLRRVKNLSPDDYSLVFGMSSGRLASRNHSFTLREYLSQLVSQSFSILPKESELSRKVKLAKVILLFEPERKSPWREKWAQCYEEKALIIDSHTFFVIALLTFLKFRAKNTFYCVRHRENYQKLATDRYVREKSFRSVFLSAILLDACEEVFGGLRNIDGLFLTSNSFTTEILRFYLLQSADCKSVCEVMHGVPTIIYERYLDRLLAAGMDFQADCKHSSISQLPYLETFGVLTSDVKVDKNVAINTYLNKYLIEVAAKSQSLSSWVTDQLAQLLKKKNLSDNLLIVSYIGGATAEKDFLSSRLFRLECLMMNAVTAALDEAERDYCFLYFPHPSRCAGAPIDYSDLESQPFFKKQKVLIYPNTVFSWFVSDIALGTFSGALFESAFFGATTFAPLAVEDQVYPKILLDRLHYQAGPKGEDLSVTLRNFVLDQVNAPPKDIYNRVNERLARLNKFETSREFRVVDKSYCTAIATSPKVV